VPVGGRGADDVVAPLVVLPDGRHERFPVGVGEPVAVDEQPEARQRPAATGVVDVAIRPQRRPQPRGAGDVPDAAARTGEIEVDERHGPPAAEDDVVQVDVVVADQPAGEGLGRRRRPGVRRGVEAADRPVVGAEQVGHADQGLVGERPRGRGMGDRGAADVGEHLAALLVDPEEPRCTGEPDVG
jgi:hypothetical protein